MSSSGDLWYVKLGSGDVHKVTLDQLDEAFQAGHVDENTMAGAAAKGSSWIRLGWTTRPQPHWPRGQGRRSPGTSRCSARGRGRPACCASSGCVRGAANRASPTDGLPQSEQPAPGQHGPR
jgi:hypothetical protein